MRTSIFLQIMVLILLVPSATAAAITEDDFNRANNDSLGNNWTEEAAGYFDIYSNKMRSTGSSSTVAAINKNIGLSQEDYNVSFTFFDLNESDEDGRVYVLVYSQSNTTSITGYLILLREDVSTVYFYYGNGTFIASENVGVSLVNNTDYVTTVENNGSTVDISLFQNNSLLTKATGFSGYQNGTVGFSFKNSVNGIAIDDFVVESLDVTENTTPNITSYTPSTPNNTYENVASTYNATINQSNSNNEWLINGTRYEWDNATDSPSYTNSTWTNGTYNLTLISHNNSDHSLKDSQTWIVTILLNSVDINVTYYDNTNLTANLIFDLSNKTPGLQTINISYSGTNTSSEYCLVYPNGTAVQTCTTATNEGETIWFNGSADRLPEADGYYINETILLDTKFEYYNGTGWQEGESYYYLWFTCFWHTAECANEEQSDSQATLKITNNGTASGIPKMKLNESAPAGIKIYVDDDNTFAGAVELSNTYQAVSTSLSHDTNVTLWAWANLSGASAWEFETYAIVE